MTGQLQLESLHNKRVCRFAKLTISEGVLVLTYVAATAIGKSGNTNRDCTQRVDGNWLREEPTHPLDKENAQANESSSLSWYPGRANRAGQ